MDVPAGHCPQLIVQWSTASIDTVSELHLIGKDELIASVVSQKFATLDSQ